MQHETTEPQTVETRLTNALESDESLESAMIELLSESEYQTSWSNHWDANPDRHGGFFVKWTPDMGYWETIETTPPETLPEDYCDGRHQFGETVMYPDDVWDFDQLETVMQNPIEHLESDPYDGFTDDFRGYAESRTGGPDSSIDLPAVKGLLFDHIRHYGTWHLAGRETWVEPEDYWATLESMNVNSEYLETFKR